MKKNLVTVIIWGLAITNLNLEVCIPSVVGRAGAKSVETIEMYVDSEDIPEEFNTTTVIDVTPYKTVVVEVEPETTAVAETEPETETTTVVEVETETTTTVAETEPETEPETTVAIETEPETETTTVAETEPETTITIPEDVVVVNDNMYTYDELTEDLAILSVKFAGKFSYEVAGITADGRNIYVCTVGNPNAEKSVFVEAGMHGREWMNPTLVMSQVEEYLDKWDVIYRDNKTYGDILTECSLIVMPMTNPDGMTISQFGMDAINNEEIRNAAKKMAGANNTIKWKANALGVDINRNFSSCWNKVIQSKVPTGGGSSNSYNGTHANSELEAQAVVAVVTNPKYNWVSALSYHSNEGAIYFDMGEYAKPEITEQCRELAIHCGNLSGYRVGEKSGKPSVARGILYNWLIIDQEIRTVLVETCKGTSPQKLSEWKSLWRACNELTIFAAYEYGSK